MKIVDTFIFNNEVGLLKYRLLILYPLVDYFVVVESNLTFTNQPKPLYYADAKSEVEQYQAEVAKQYNLPYTNKIIHVVVKDMPAEGDAWNREGFQRNCIDRGVCSIAGLEPMDLILIQDVDEFPDPNLLAKIKSQEAVVTQPYALSQGMYYYNLECFVSDNWRGTVMIPFKDYEQIKRRDGTNNLVAYYNSTVGSSISTPYYHVNVIRNKSAMFAMIHRCGWHLSYFGDAQFIKTKLQSFSHQEHNNEHNTNIEVINERMKNKVDVVGRNEKYQVIPLNANPYLPPHHEVLYKLLGFSS